MNRSNFSVSTIEDQERASQRQGPPGGKDRRESFDLDTTRLFYMRTSATLGAFRHTWDSYVIDMETKKVFVIWHNENAGLSLEGTDAFSFLKIVRDHNAYLFHPDNQEQSTQESN